MIRRCKNPFCKHEFQDATYGPGMRVMNRKKSDIPTFCCTVCDKDDSATPPAKKKEKGEK